MAFKIHGEITMDGAQFKRSLEEARAQSFEFLKTFVLGAVGIASVEQAFDKTIESAKELVNTSKKLDVTIEQLQVLRQAAEENGLEFNAMTTALERFNAVRENVLSGGKGASTQLAALRRLGVNPAQLADQTAAQSLMGQISATAQKSNAADIANDLKQVFGRNGEELFGVLKTNFEDLNKEMESTGGLMSTEVAQKLKTVSDDFGLLARIIEASLAPAILQLSASIYKMTLTAIKPVAGLGSYWGAAYESFVEAKGSKPNFPSWLQGGGNSLFSPNSPTAKINDSIWSFFSRVNTGLNSGAAADAQDKTEKSWQTMIDNFTKMLAEPPKPPKPPGTTIPQDDPASKRKAAHGRGEHTDSLIDVGNFLGSGANSIGTLAQQQLDVSKKQLDVLNKIQDNTRDQSSNDFGVDFE